MGEDRAPPWLIPAMPCSSCSREAEQGEAHGVCSSDTLPPLLHPLGISSFLPRDRGRDRDGTGALIHGPKREHPAPKGLWNDPSPTLAAPVTPLKDHMIWSTVVWSCLAAGAPQGKYFLGKCLTKSSLSRFRLSILSVLGELWRVTPGYGTQLLPVHRQSLLVPRGSEPVPCPCPSLLCLSLLPDSAPVKCPEHPARSSH